MTTPSKQLQVMAPEEPSIGLMLQALIEKGNAGENVKALEALCGLKERMDAKAAEREFAAAFCEMQKETPRIEASKIVPDNQGNQRYRFAPYEEIMKQVAPLLAAHGFSVSFNTRREEDKVTAICTLTHKSGHSRVNEFTVRIGSGPPKASEAQADGAAKTYAKRFALTDALNIVVAGLDNDAAAIGGPITPEQAEGLRTRVLALPTVVSEKKFLALVGVEDYAAIPADQYDYMCGVLTKAESKAQDA